MASLLEIHGKGGCAGPDLCRKHKVPMIHTITGDSLCAVCERAMVVHMLKKIDHGCTDMNCRICDKGD